MTHQSDPLLQPLPSEGAERTIFIRALQQFSDDCQPPDLHAHCPFSVDVPTGGRGCAEECMDILAKYGDPFSLSEAIDLGNGIAALRRRPKSRPRRGPEAGSRPFDARAILARDRDSDRSITTWSTVSLMTILVEQITRSPGQSGPNRTYNIKMCWKELERRDHDVVSYIRWGIGRAVATNIVLAIFSPYLDVKGHEALSTVREIPPGWKDLLDMVDKPEDPLDSVDTSPDEARERNRRIASSMKGPFAELTLTWARTASIDDLIAWKPPADPQEVTNPVDPGGTPDEREATFQWLVERFTRTYLADWSKAALHLEWRYLHKQLVAPCPSLAMHQRRIDESELAKEIARRAVPALDGSRFAEDITLGVPSLSIDRLTTTAAEFLEAGRRSAALALFEAAKRDYPSDPEVLNNYGFCMLPASPKEGLDEIEAAGRLGYTRQDIILANRLYGLFLQNRFTSALRAAEDLYSKEESHHDAYLWDWRKPPESTVPITIDSRRYAVELSLHITRKISDVTEWNVWADRATRLGLNPED